MKKTILVLAALLAFTAGIAAAPSATAACVDVMGQACTIGTTEECVNGEGIGLLLNSGEAVCYRGD